MARFLAIVLALIAMPAFAANVRLEPQECKFFNALNATANRDSTATNAYSKPFDVRSMRSIGVCVTGTSLGATDATIQVQVSMDQTNWVNKGSAATLDNGTAVTKCISITDLTEGYAKVVYSHGSVAAGTLTGYCAGKEH